MRYDVLELYWFYDYKAWCRLNEVDYQEADDLYLFLEEFMMQNPLYKAGSIVLVMQWGSKCIGK